MNPGNRFVACAATLVVALAACGGDTEQALITSARSSLERGDLEAASVQIKSAIQKYPNSAQARFVFGKLLAESGRPREADVELRKAQDLNYPADEVIPLLAENLVAQQQYQKVISDYAKVALQTAARQADLSAALATAYDYIGERDKAIATVDAAVSRAPDNLPIRLVQARLIAAKGDIDGALKITGRLVSEFAKNANAWQLQGDLYYYGKNDHRHAEAAYRKVLEIRRNDISAFAKLVDISLADNNLESAKREFDAMKKAAPNHPLTALRGAKVDANSGEYGRARDRLAPLIKLYSDNPDVLLVAAAAELGLNSPARGEDYLNRVLSLRPRSTDARRMLSALYMRRGEPARALEVLAPLLDGAQQDTQALTLAAEAHLLSGNAAKAEAFFAQVAQLKPNDIEARTALALARMAKGESAAAFAELQSIAAGDKGSFVDMVLINARMRRADLHGALQAIDALSKKMPNKAMPADLRGRVYFLQRDSAKARESFDKAIALEPDYFPSVAALAQLDVADGRSDAAQRRLDALLTRDPKSVPALVALAGLRARQRAPADEVADLLARAVAAKPGVPRTTLLLIDHWLGRNNPKRALEAAQAGLAVSPDEPSLLDALGRAQLAGGQIAAALSTFGKLALQQPKATLPQMRIADAYLRAGKRDEAERAYRRALEISPDLLAAQRGLMLAAVQAKQPEKALQVARTIERQRPNDAVGQILEGDTYVAFKDTDAAVRSYRAGLSKRGGGEAAIRLHNALAVAGREQEAGRFAEDWLKQNPKDTRLRSHLGEAAIAASDFASAERYLEQVVKLEPDNATAVNNLAFALAKQGKPAAVTMAEQALSLAPENPHVLDTLAQALAARNNLDRAIEASKSAVRLAPDQPSFRLNLAKLCVKANDRKCAKAELDELAKLGADFPRQQEVTLLIKSIS